jgi:hypothetical protein
VLRKSERITIQSTVHPGVSPEPVLIGHVIEDNFLALWRVAPQIGPDRKFFGRLVLRAFATYANWSNGFRGYVGGVPSENRTSG